MLQKCYSVFKYIVILLAMIVLAPWWDAGSKSKMAVEEFKGDDND